MKPLTFHRELGQEGGTQGGQGEPQEVTRELRLVMRSHWRLERWRKRVSKGKSAKALGWKELFTAEDQRSRKRGLEKGIL